MQRDPDGSEKQAIEKILSPLAGDILEIGCGNGRLTEHLSGTCRTLTALDPDLPSLMEARASLPDSVRFLSGSGEKLPLVKDCVDMVVFSLSLHHQNAVKGLVEAERVLKRSGRVLVMEPAVDSLMNLLFTFVHDETGEYVQAEGAVRNCGLRVLQSGSIRMKWVFEDFDEMIKYIFGYYGLIPDPEKEREMRRLLDQRQEVKPLNIDDITRFWLLGE